MCGDYDILDVMERRYSVRSYSDRPVEKDKLNKILRAAQVAPTAVNKRPQRLFVLESKKALEKASKVTRFTFGAPMIILVCSDKTKGWTTNDGQYLGTVDASIVMTQMMLEATELGLGTCWVRGFVQDDVTKVFELPDNLIPEAMLVLGYPSETAKPGPMHSEGITMEEMVRYL